MKQIFQSYKTGKLALVDVPSPLCMDNGVLVKTSYSLLSPGTEKLMIELAKKSLIGKARARPDLVVKVIEKIKQIGIKGTLKNVFSKLDNPVPLGYSCAGTVIETGSTVMDLSINQRVACGGAGYANHSEINFIPRNLCVKVPENVEDIEAAFITVGAIALQGVRQAQTAIGERVAVLGLGLIGQITVQLLKSAGCRVLGMDIDKEKNHLAKKIGADMVCNESELIDAAMNFSQGYGVDRVIITASTKSNAPIETAGEISRLKGSVIVLGSVGMKIPRNTYYKKELELKLSMSYGPGRYDPVYEEKGIDYPYSYVRWTEQRNFSVFLDLIAEKKINVKGLITHTFNITDALQAYNLLDNKKHERYMGILLKYSLSSVKINKKKIIVGKSKIKTTAINVGFIGAGNFARSILIPHIKKIKQYNLLGICTATGLSGYSTARKHGFNYISTNSDDVFKDKSIDAVFIATRHKDHFDKAIKAIKYQKHLFIEKPLCIMQKELDEIKKLYIKTKEKIIIQVGFNRRFSPFAIKVKNIIAGMPVFINYRINAGIAPLNSWVQDRETSGGRIIGEVCHFIDFCSYILDSIPVCINATTLKTSDKSIPDEDNAAITLTYKNGSIAVINYLAYGSSKLEKEYIEIFFKDIAIKIVNFKKLVMYSQGGINKQKLSNQDKGHSQELKAFKDSILTGISAIPFESIYNTTYTTFKIIEAVRENKTIWL